MRRFSVSGDVAAIVAAAAVAAAAIVLAAPDPDLEWWMAADPDGAYLGSALNLVIGNHTSYLDHPGLPTQVALAAAFKGWLLADGLLGRAPDAEAWVDARMLDLNGTRPVYWTLALVYHVGGALLAFALAAKLFRHWSWGLAGGLLFVAAPKLTEQTFSLRPDAAVSALALLVAYLIATAIERGSAPRLLAAAFALGFAVTVKLVAAALVVPVALAALAVPTVAWFERSRAAASAAFRRHYAWLLPVAAVWLLACVEFNRQRLPIVSNDAQRGVLVNGGTFLAGLAAATALAARFRISGASRLFAPFHTGLVLAFVAGLAVPATLVLDDGLQMVAAIYETFTGGRVNASVEPFADFELRDFTRWPLLETAIVLVCGVAAGVVGLLRRCWWPPFLALGSILLATLAAARLSEDYYYAPAHAVAIPGALWVLGRSRRGRFAPVPVWILVALVFLPMFRHPVPRPDYATVNDAAQLLAGDLLQPGEVIVAPASVPVEDPRFRYVEAFVDRSPEYRRRFVDPAEIPAARELGLVPRYYVAPVQELDAVAAARHVDLGEGFVPVRPLPTRWGPGGAYGVAELRSAAS